MEIRRTLSAGTLNGDRVRNMQGEDLGKVEEIMVDVESGCVSYVVLSHGGFLGLGDKLFAVPWKAMQIDMDNHEFVLDMSRDRFENGPGFDKNDWPDFSSEEYGNQIHDFYGVDRPSWFSSSSHGMPGGMSSTEAGVRDDVYDTGSRSHGGMSHAEGSSSTGSYGTDYEPEYERESGFGEQGTFERPGTVDEGDFERLDKERQGTFGEEGFGNGHGRDDFSLMDCDEAGLTEEERIRCREQRAA
jgi:sporulation protein YlmC with PRC-barrel domain